MLFSPVSCTLVWAAPLIIMALFPSSVVYGNAIPTETTPIGCRDFDSRKFTSAFNAHRKHEGRAKVKNMDALDRVAAYSAWYMAKHPTTNKRSPQNTNTLGMLERAGCSNCVSAYEVVERGYRTIQQVVDAYYTNPTLIQDEFDLPYTHFGISRWYSAGGIPYYSIIFARVSGDEPEYPKRSPVYPTPARLCGSVLINSEPTLSSYAGTRSSTESESESDSGYPFGYEY
ncbi:hypothetical protein BJ684DRAFT_16400 [Piptocephalis cylindrospora]|uniref:SCP domain-containing protein n=1 Tax=Piptocephalis cylindrospora TaxID=1907219 RepID=A0A4P9Y4T6_9FUNG|nr:hypothetical protein BJ684DRAFT_16400 [Piptocephalis cylindrospora]|eukprot:RKP13171.1 hypothetical protein BJ684DRAFT_16400 [Piptocephalis cylindrospora]